MISNYYLNYINLSSNFCLQSDLISKAIANTILHNQSITHLFLSYNNLQINGVKYIADAMKSNKFIVEASFYMTQKCMSQPESIQAQELIEYYLEQNKIIKEKGTATLNALLKILICAHENKIDILKELKMIIYPKEILIYLKYCNKETMKSLKNIVDTIKNIWDANGLIKIGASICLPHNLKSAGAMQTIFSYFKGVSDFNVKNDSSKALKLSKGAKQDVNSKLESLTQKYSSKTEQMQKEKALINFDINSNNSTNRPLVSNEVSGEDKKQDSYKVMQMQDRNSASMSNYINFYLKNKDIEKQQAFEKEDSKTVAPTSDQDWGVILKNIGTTIWQYIFNKITTEQVLNAKESSVYNYATKIEMFSIWEKIENPLKQFNKAISGTYLEEKYKQQEYAEEHGYKDRLYEHHYHSAPQPLAFDQNYLTI